MVASLVPLREVRQRGDMQQMVEFLWWKAHLLGITTPWRGSCGDSSAWTEVTPISR